MTRFEEIIPLSSACLVILSAVSFIWITALLFIRPVKAQNLVLAQAFFFTAMLGILHAWGIIAPTIPLLILIPCLKFLSVPTLFVYLRMLLPPGLKWNIKWIYHFLPGVLVTLSLLLLQNFYSWNLDEWRSFTKMIFRPLGILQGACYIILSFQAIKNAKELLLKNTSHWDKVQLTWAWLFFMQYFALWLSNIFELFLTDFIYPKLLWNIIAIIGQGALTVYAIRNSFTFTSIDSDEISENKISKTGLSDDDLKIEADKLIQKLQTCGAFMQPNFSLNDLSKLLSKPAYQVSEIINRGLHQSFFDLINSLRIDAAKKVFESKESSEKTIIEIAYEVGYNSKSAFNTSFKKWTGTTPSLFREKTKSILT